MNTSILISMVKGEAMNEKEYKKIIHLPEPLIPGKMPLEETIQKRRSVRNYKKYHLNLNEISQILWAAQGITGRHGFRTVPSAGALYPLEVYILTGDDENTGAGIYRYIPGKHSLELKRTGDKRDELYNYSLNQGAVKQASAVIIICAVFKRTTSRYGDRGIRYVFMEAGHAAQNIALQSVALGLGSVPIGAFNDRDVKKMLGLSDDEISEHEGAYFALKNAIKKGIIYPVKLTKVVPVSRPDVVVAEAGMIVLIPAPVLEKVG